MAFEPIKWGDRDRTAALLAMWGFANSFIESKTGLSAGQITYRLRKLDMRSVRRDYRNGESEIARKVLSAKTNGPMPDVRPDIVRRIAVVLAARKTGKPKEEQ